MSAITIVGWLGLCVCSPAQEQGVELRRLTAADGERLHYMGWSTALSGERALVGAPYENDQGTAAGAVYVFERDASGSWQQVAQLRSSDGEEGYYFGVAVALELDCALVGTPGDDEPVHSSGSVLVFERDAAGVWHEIVKLETGRPGEGFGTDVAMQGHRAVIGAPFPDDQPGNVFVYERDALGQWIQTALLTASDGAGANQFGTSVALSGDRILIGADLDSDQGLFAGSAYVFERDSGGNWVEQAKLLAERRRHDGSVRDHGRAIRGARARRHRPSGRTGRGLRRGLRLRTRSGRHVAPDGQADGSRRRVQRLLRLRGVHLRKAGPDRSAG